MCCYAEMKMAKSPIRKKSDKKLDPIVNQAIKDTTNYIKQWTLSELGKIQKEQHNPVCVQTDTGYRVGLYKLELNPDQTCALYNVNSELMHVFESKLSAIIYTIYTIKHRYKDAAEILQLDTEINKNYTDVVILQRQIRRAKETKQFDVMDIRQARLDNAQERLFLARNRISKIHKYAKYNKIWE